MVWPCSGMKAAALPLHPLSSGTWPLPVLQQGRLSTACWGTKCLRVNSPCKHGPSFHFSIVEDLSHMRDRGLCPAAWALSMTTLTNAMEHVSGVSTVPCAAW